ncbi:MAG: ABC transporter permease, partial [Saprospiraceae bacterium]
STNGKSQTIAKRLKEILAEALPDQLDDLLMNMHQLRNRLAGNFEDKVRLLNEHTKLLIDHKEE